MEKTTFIFYPEEKKKGSFSMFFRQKRRKKKQKKQFLIFRYSGDVCIGKIERSLCQYDLHLGSDVLAL
jgi:hypothetical protein